ncbi:MAG: hypothetical protein ACI37R_08480 [Candidatus Avigastranaerophilus sp.]
MYKIDMTAGCLTTIIFLLLIGFIIKQLWWLIVGIIIIAIVAYYANLIYETISNKKAEKEANYTPEMGEVYKVCPYCGTEVKANAGKCPVCKHGLN